TEDTRYLLNNASRIVHALIRLVAMESSVPATNAAGSTSTAAATVAAAGRAMSSALGSGSPPGEDAEGGNFSAVVGSPKELARMGVVGLSCMVCRLKMRYIPFVAP
ncbi:unnamed protein product, partial [Ectocarpus sp. 12 AP-2014]